jgi:hypothetical protein
MFTWSESMPQGMSLKSDGFASNLSDPEGKFTLADYCREQNIVYDDTRVPVDIQTFISYGKSFQERMVPELEETLVSRIDKVGDRFHLQLENGDTADADLVVMAVGISHYRFIPDNLSHLSPQYLSHSADHKYPDRLRGKNVTVLGAGASALDLAVLMHESGTNVQVIARRSALTFHAAPGKKTPSLWKRMRWPRTGIGPGWKSRFFTKAPHAFHALPQELRLRIVKSYLGPSAGWSLRERFVDRIPVQLGCTIQSAEVIGDKVHLTLQGPANQPTTHVTDHIVAATGYRVDMRRLSFLSPELRAGIACVENTPILSTAFQSSVPGLYFVGVSSANSFGPMMRFAYGAAYTAKRLSRQLARVAVNTNERTALTEATN